MSDTEFDEAMDRLLDGSRCDSWAELAEFLGIQPSAISQANRQKKNIPSNWLLTLLRKRMVNPEWVLHGYPNSKMLQPKKQTTVDLLRELIAAQAAVV